MKNFLFALAALLAVSGCASGSGFWSNSYTEYESYNCNQLEDELMLVTAKIDEISDRQQREQVIGAAMNVMGYSVERRPVSDEWNLPNLKARQDALQHLLVKKDCSQKIL